MAADPLSAQALARAVGSRAAREALAEALAELDPECAAEVICGVLDDLLDLSATAPILRHGATVLRRNGVIDILLHRGDQDPAKVRVEVTLDTAAIAEPLALTDLSEAEAADYLSRIAADLGALAQRLRDRALGDEP